MITCNTRIYKGLCEFARDYIVCYADVSAVGTCIPLLTLDLVKDKRYFLNAPRIFVPLFNNFNFLSRSMCVSHKISRKEYYYDK